MGRADGKVAVITGAASGVGLAATRLFAREGAKVLAVDVMADVLRNEATMLGPSVVAFVADVTREDQMATAMAAAEGNFGGIDVVIANAGIFGKQAVIGEVSLEDFERVMTVNVVGVVATVKCAVPYLVRRGGGSILITGSVGAVIGNAGAVAYTASKHALVGVMKVAARELASCNVRVNMVNPALVKTPMMNAVAAEICPEEPERGRAQLQNATFFGRLIEPEEVAEMMLYLSSPFAVNCTGGMFMIDGGMQYSGAQPVAKIQFGEWQTKVAG